MRASTGQATVESVALTAALVAVALTSVAAIRGAHDAWSRGRSVIEAAALAPAPARAVRHLTIRFTPGANASPAARHAVRMALSFVGTPYVWGGATPAGFDCSGLVVYVFGAAVPSLPRTTYDQVHAGVAVPPDAATAGDLVFFYHADGTVGHVGIYLGDGRMVHAPHTGDVVRVTSLQGYPLRIAAIRRVA